MQELGLQRSVYFLPSFTDRQRALILAASRGVLYTPRFEHFGIVPLEAMASGTPVVACNSGGPTESIPEGVGGLLCDPTPAAWAAAMARLCDGGAAADMGRNARLHVQRHFGRQVFGDKLNEIVARTSAGT